MIGKKIIVDPQECVAFLLKSPSDTSLCNIMKDLEYLPYKSADYKSLYYIAGLVLHVWRMVTENYVWRMKSHVRRNVSKSDATFQNLPPDAIFCDHASDVYHEWHSVGMCARRWLWTLPYKDCNIFFVLLTQVSLGSNSFYGSPQFSI